MSECALPLICCPEFTCNACFDNEVRNNLSKLDGTETAAVSLLTGLSADELADLGGLDDLA